MRTEWALMVMPRSRSRSMASSTWACISRAVKDPVNSSRRSASVDFPWSMCAMIAKLRMKARSIAQYLILTAARSGGRERWMASKRTSAGSAILVQFKLLSLTGLDSGPCERVGSQSSSSSACRSHLPKRFPRLYLACGVTTIRTTGSLEPYTDLEIKKKIEHGEIPGPKMHVTGPYLEGEGSWALQMHQLTGPQDATRVVNYWLDAGVDTFKAYMFITADELSAAVQAAHKRHATVTGHLCSIGFREAARLGIDDLEHGLVVDTEFFPWKTPGQCPDQPNALDFISKLDLNRGPVHDMIDDLVQHHVSVTSTLPVFEMFVPGRPARSEEHTSE